VRAGIAPEEVAPLGAATPLLRRVDLRAVALFGTAFALLVGATAARRCDASQARAHDLAVFDQASKRLAWPGVEIEGLLRQLLPFGFGTLNAPATVAAALPNWLVNAMADHAR
jgi:hypothetical protein